MCTWCNTAPSCVMLPYTVQLEHNFINCFVKMLVELIVLQISTAAFTLVYLIISKALKNWLTFLKRQTVLYLPCSDGNSFQAIKCSFANSYLGQQGCNEGTAIFSSKLMGKTCSVIVVDVLQEEMMSSFAVDVVLPDCKYIWHGYGREGKGWGRGKNRNW